MSHPPSDLQTVMHRIEAMEATFLARLETLRVERETGDRQLEQFDRFIKDQVNDNTKGLGQASAEIQTLKHDLQKSLNQLREEIRSVVKEAVKQTTDDIRDSSSNAQEAADSISGRLVTLEDRWKVGRGVAIGLGLTSVAQLGLLANVLSQLTS